MKDAMKLDLPFIERNISRHGKIRYYFRVNGKRIARLPDNREGKEFSEKYWDLRAALDQGETPTITLKNIKSTLPQPNTFHYLCVFYLKSSAYQQLDSTTQAKRRAIIDSMLLEPLTPTSTQLFKDMPISALDTSNIEVLRDRKQNTPFAADERLKILRQIFEVATPILVKHNVAKLVKPFRRSTQGHKTLRSEHIEQFIKYHGGDSKAVLALTILMYTGLRVSDLAHIGPQHRRGDNFSIRVYKNRNRKPVSLDIPIHPILDGLLSMHKTSNLAYMVTEFGKPFSIKGLGQRVSEWFKQAGLEGYTAHSVRKGLATTLAENEATDHMLEGLFGWSDGKTSKIYTRNAQRSRLAKQAVSRIDWGEIGNVLPHPNQILEFQATIKDKKALKFK